MSKMKNVAILITTILLLAAGNGLTQDSNDEW